jgi:hypothetical protein
MAYPALATKQDLINEIVFDLRKATKMEKIKIYAKSFRGILEELLDGLSQKHGVGAVVLIDEYDAPVSWNIFDRKLASDISDVLHGFYSSLKRNLKNIRFALVTGITRFTMTALDSGPNNFMDISLMPDFGGVCGFTVSEFDSLFSAIFNRDTVMETLERMKEVGAIGDDADEAALKDMILQWYDGYNGLGPEHVLNPFSILHFFVRKEFDDYWTMLGVPSHLAAFARKNPLEFFLPSLESYTSKQIKKIELGDLAVAPLLFHSGYLVAPEKRFRVLNRHGGH